MKIINATIKDLEEIKRITYGTIREIYPHYYPKGAVDFFLSHHSEENIRQDIQLGSVYLLREESGKLAAGTVTIQKNEIKRLFVLPEFQKRGFGRELLWFAEQSIGSQYKTIRVDASMPAKEIYLKRGYKECAFQIIPTEYQDFLCYDEMEKSVPEPGWKIWYEGKAFTSRENSVNGEVDGRTVFSYHQNGDTLWADYAGGDIIKGSLTGTVSEEGVLDFYYHHRNKAGEMRIGKCHSVPELLENGKIRLHENWQWLCGDLSDGTSILEECE